MGPALFCTQKNGRFWLTKREDAGIINLQTERMDGKMAHWEHRFFRFSSLGFFFSSGFFGVDRAVCQAMRTV